MQATKRKSIGQANDSDERDPNDRVGRIPTEARAETGESRKAPTGVKTSSEEANQGIYVLTPDLR
jgi:hypothetical protein